MNRLFRAGRGVDQEYRELCAHQNAVRDIRSSEAAALLCLAHAGVELMLGSIDAMVENLALVAQQHNLTPDAMQGVLEEHEQSLEVTIERDIL